MDQEPTFAWGGETYTRQRVTATIRLVKKDEMPTAVAHASQKTVESLYWQDGTNPDLVYTQFILDTEGDNQNWDYMPRPSLVQSYATAKYKPMDMEHIIVEDSSMVHMDKKAPPVKNTIFGVMTHSALANANGTLLTAKEIEALDLSDDWTRKDKDKVCVVGYAALYNFLFPETVKDTLAAATDGSMKVSMERWIRKYDFLYRDAKGSVQSMSKEDAETKGLFRAWAQRQPYNGYPIWRRSLEFVYGGVASTTNPANSMAGYLTQSTLKAAASKAVNSPAVQKLLDRHSELHREFAVALDENRKQELIAEHASIHQHLYDLGKLV